MYMYLTDYKSYEITPHQDSGDMWELPSTQVMRPHEDWVRNGSWKTRSGTKVRSSYGKVRIIGLDNATIIANSTHVILK